MNTTRSHPLSLVLCTLLLAALTAIMLEGCNRRSPDDEEESGQSPPATVPVKTAPVVRGDVATTVTATGRTNALRNEKIFSPIAGKVVVLRALEGASFRSGDLMAVIRPKEAEAAVTGAEALLRAAKTPAQEAEARRTLELAKSAESRVELRARFNGTVASRNISEGELVGDNAELFTLVDLSTLMFLADVPLSALPVIHKGENAEVRFTGLSDGVFHGVVDAVSPQSDPQSQTVRVRLHFTGSQHSLLKTDMAGTARIITGVHRRVLLVPRPALLRNDENNTYSVVVVTADSLARTVPVNVGVLSDSNVEITSGALQEGMNVVVEGNYALADSTKVTVAGSTSQ